MHLTKLSTLLLVLAATTTAVTAEAAASSSKETPECTLSDSSSGSYYDLRPLQLGNHTHKVDGFDTGYLFAINVCSVSADASSDSAAQWLRNGQRGLMGRVSTTPFLRGERLLLEYTGGDVCPENPRLRQSTLLSFICDKTVQGAGSPEFVTEWDHCAFVFEWRTPYACPVEHLASTPDSPLSPPAQADDNNSEDGGGLLDSNDRNSVIFIAIFLVGSIYILGGFLYNRVFNSTRELRGLEQLPNYALWHAIYSFFRTCILTVFDIVACRRSIVRRNGSISLDSEEFNIRTQLFDSDDESDDAQPLEQRSR